MKSVLRKEILTKRKSMAQADVEEKSQQIHNRLIELSLVENPQVILCYMDFRNEVKTEGIIEYLLDQEKIVVLPKVNKETQQLDLYQIQGFKDLITSEMGILEPTEHLPQILPSDVDLILAPGVAFDLQGYRMGYGGGFYDKLLPQVRPDCNVIGLAFDIQIIPELPIESHDQSMNAIVTETQFIHNQSNGK